MHAIVYLDACLTSMLHFEFQMGRANLQDCESEGHMLMIVVGGMATYGAKGLVSYGGLRMYLHGLLLTMQCFR